jgi:PAS domain S-box-containing protein
VRELLEESSGKLHPSSGGKPLGEEMEVLRQYNEALFRKLERKVVQLEGEISERKRAEQAVRAREALLRGILDNVQDAYVRNDLAGNITMSSPSAARMFGFSFAEEMKGFPSSSLYADPKERESIVEEMRIDGFLTDRIGLGQRRDGTPFWVSMNAQPCRDENGEIVGTEAFVREITERKKADEERQRLEEQLRTSQKLEAIGSLAGGVAHDFNNLLSVILGCTEFALLKVKEGDPAHADLQEIRRTTGRAAALTSQLLAFGRKQMLKPVPLDLNGLVTETEKMLRRILGEDIDIALALVEDLGMVKADPGQIGQVIMNLAINARDAMPEGGDLTIETANVEIDPEFSARHLALEPGPYVCLAVTDTGCGMDGATRARIFEPFFTTKEKGRGTGLGLSMVYGIVKQSGGDVWVYSEPGIGTTFKIYLPRLPGSSSPHSGAPKALA